jgi:hypothetical protein
VGTSHDHRTALAGRPKLEVADLFRLYQHELQPLSPIQAKAVRDLLDCRTARMGGHVSECQNCGEKEISYNSCRNRHCPRCQFLARARWREAREGELLPVPYFHVVFTLPHVLNPLILCNQQILYELLFRSVSQTLKQVSLRKLKGASLGFIAVLHTWGQNLMYHPHLHLIVPGGGLSADESKWVKTPENYLLPTKVLSEVFRGKYLSELERLRPDLRYPGSAAEYENPGRFKNLLIQAASKPWVVYVKRPFAGPKQVLNYLGNYTHRIAVSNHRILKLENHHVTFRYRDYRDGGKNKEMKLHASEFMRRFLLHVLPSRFVRIRHYGMLGSRFKKQRLEKVRTILGAKSTDEPQAQATSATSNWEQWMKEKTGVDPRRCRSCKDGTLTKIITLERWPWSRRRGRYPLGLHSARRGAFDTS